MTLQPGAIFMQKHDEWATALEESGNFRVLRRMRSPRPPLPDTERMGVGAIVDVETTGLDVANDKLIELGMVKFAYCRDTGAVLRELSSFTALEDPGIPIPAEASRVNGIRDEDVAGKRIDDSTVAAWLGDVQLVIAHNAKFDRAILERRFPAFETKAFACSNEQIDWAGEGFGTAKLDYLAYRLGFFYDAHRADADCLALLEVLSRPLPQSGVIALRRLLEAARGTEVKVTAIDSKFETKDLLKARGYRWCDGSNGQVKGWWNSVSPERYDSEIAWLKASIYGNRSFRVATETLHAFTRFSPRGGERQIAHH